MPNRMFRRESKGFWPDFIHALQIMPGMFLSVCVLWFGPSVWGHLETQVYPVMLPASIDQVTAVDGGVMLSATARKQRECSWVSTTFHLGERDGLNVPITAKPHLEGPKVNGPGLLHWDKIFLPGIVKDQVPRTFADTVHLCTLWGWVQWNVTSKFWN